MVPLANFIDLPEAKRAGKYPYIWTVDKKNQLMRVLVAEEIVRSTEERRNFWHTLKALAGISHRVDPEAIADQVRSETAQKLAQGLMAMLGGDGAPMQEIISPTASASRAGDSSAAAAFEPAWIEQAECTSCDECIAINSGIFAYDDEKKAFVKNPKGGPFKDIVRAAEKCTGQCIHPGTPSDPGEADLDKLIKRAEKYN
jgi:pyruvate-ferredoxin/flavodoxin oxidoreductase